ncbi:NAD(P)H dehydrogenase (quinone) [Tistlia consotensis]|uniref:NAD(P)H dehydrogenase (quinone) n=1 Tax=Tistlia consotensis USBA 355 TaxID=560819 RepID=A0A1Y6C7Z1_9PROT|nr:NAD(P)H:quinone oxidoreductase [Tistlia consotensis]SMF41232.1 NAD(P)H dehydrogenase (quinone) [Tistlia consotensis USBA 355]SNR73876.1 NAD(P)H dehydrogenase (quinone) [Tistlia consotensis]
MSKVLVLYYSAYGHIAAMAAAAAEGARQAGASVATRRVPELLDDAAARQAGHRPDDTAVASVEELAGFDAILFGMPTRFGNMASQMKHFLDRCGGLWVRNALVGRVGSVFTSSGSQHGGQEHTLLAMQASLQHLGMVIVGLPYSFRGQTRMDEITGGSPYGATTLAATASGGWRQPSANELEGARHQGRHVAEIAAALARGGLGRPRDCA